MVIVSNRSVSPISPRSLAQSLQVVRPLHLCRRSPLPTDRQFPVNDARQYGGRVSTNYVSIGFLQEIPILSHSPAKWVPGTNATVRRADSSDGSTFRDENGILIQEVPHHQALNDSHQ